MRALWSKIRNAFGKRSTIALELDEEMDAHLQFLMDENLERGMRPDEARTAARREFGNVRSVREKTYRTWQFPRLESFLQDLRYGLRGIFRTPVFSLVVILTLAIGIGANTAIFSTVYAVLLKPLPYPAGERLVWLGESSAKATGISVTWINFEHWQSDSRSFDGMAGFQNADLTLTGRGQALLTHAGLVTNRFFQLTGSRAALGRLFTAADDKAEKPETVVVTESFWAKTLGADPQIVGKTLTLNGSAYEVVGVLARDPGFFLRPVDYYLPLRPSAAQAAKRDAHGSMRVLGLLKPGVTLAEARTDLNTILERLAKADPGPEDGHRVYAAFLTDERTEGLGRVFVILMSAVALVLLLACANIASLLLIRMTTRAREMAIRTAIGAGRSRIARQLVTETLLITAIGGAAGVLLAHFCLRLLVQFAPRDIPRLAEATLNVPVLLFAAAVTIAVGLFCALAPIFSSGGVNLSILLKESTKGAGSNRVGHAIRGGLVVAEIAMAVVLLFVSGILMRSLYLAEAASPGFDSSDLLALELQLPSGKYKADAAILDFYNRLEDSLRAQPGVESVGAVNCPPGAGDCGDWWYSVAEKPTPARDDVPLTLLNVADPQYFNAMKIRLVAGRGPSSEDRADGPAVVIINEELAHAWWKDARSAIGQHIKLGGPYMKGPVLEIVGVAGNVPQMGLDSAPYPEIYFPSAQRVSSGMVVAIRTHGDPEQAAAMVRRTLALIDQDVPIQSLKPFDERLGATLKQRRFIAVLLAIFAGIAVLLAAIGCYGVLNYWVSSRRQDIAIRIAMGAGSVAIVRRIGRQAAMLAAAGLAMGLVGSWLASRWIASMVFGITAHDPAVLGFAAAGALMMVMAAAAFPLWRAVRVSPIETLREA
ncbi:ABC transporter permease [Occallatibacter savannae]|uniref:ABC transporter permease n=1 Tax=Occallatibacter savannae TaxID=1002691 RepID=UPI000D6948F2|nr:ABC transporter permease [Occallatibacter savannae]